MIIKILFGTFIIIGLYIIYIMIKGGIQLEIEFDELAMVYTYSLLVIYKKYLTGKEDIQLSCEVTDDIGYLFNPFNFKTFLTKAAKGYIIRYFKDNYYVLNETKEKWPAQAADLERLKRAIDKWI